MMDLREFERMGAVEDRMWWYVGMRAITAALLKRHLPQRAGLHVLDAGCGTGANLAFLRHYGRVTGFDFASQALHGCRARGETGVCRASILQIPFGDASFDMATSFDVLVMLTRDDGAEALRELARVTRPGGHVLVRSAAYNWLRGRHDEAWATRHRYVAHELEAHGRAAGLTPVLSSYANTLLFPVALAKRQMERWLSSHSASDTEIPGAMLNRLLTAPMLCEAALLRRIRLPFGLSVMTLFRKLVVGRDERDEH